MTLEMALKEQFQAGEAKGLAKGREEGLAEGEAKGLSAGYENSIAIIRDLKNGMSVQQASEKYYLPVEQVMQFQELM